MSAELGNINDDIQERLPFMPPKNVFYCSECGTHPKHIEVYQQPAPEYSRFVDYDDNDNPIYETVSKIAIILKCPSCHSMRFQRIETIEGYNPKIENFPIFNYPILNNILPQDKLSPELYSYYDEAIEGYNAERYFSCGALVRLIVERLCFEQGLTQANLFQKIENFNTNPDYITALHNIRELGNNTLHHFYKPKRKEVKMAIFVLEYLLSEFHNQGFQHFQTLKTRLEEFKDKPKRGR